MSVYKIIRETMDKDHRDLPADYKMRCPKCKNKSASLCRLPGCTDYWKCSKCEYSWHDPTN